MSEVAIQASTPETAVSAVIMQLNKGQIENAIASFADEFRFKDHGIGLEFRDKKSLAEFFQKIREFYPNSSIHIDVIFVSGDHVIGQWTFQTTLDGPSFADRYGRSLCRSKEPPSYAQRMGRLPTGRITTMD